MSNFITISFIVYSSVSSVIFYLMYLNVRHLKEEINSDKKITNDKFDSLLLEVENLVNMLDDEFKSHEKKITDLKSLINNVKEELENLNSKNNDLEKISEYFSIAKPIDSKDSKMYSFHSKNILKNYKIMTYRQFIDTYSNYKFLSLSNFEDIRANSSIPADFTETDLGECIAIPIENDIYAIFIKKGLELKDMAFQASGISFIYELSEEPLTGFSYSDWEITKLPMFKKLSNNKWICLEKGYLKLTESSKNRDLKEEKIIIEENKKDINENILDNTLNKEIISEISFINKNINKDEENKKNKELDLINNFNTLDNMSFIEKYNCQFFDVENLVDSFLNGNKLEFFRANGKYLFVNDFSVKNRYYLFYKKGEVICKNFLMKQIFDFPKNSKDNSDYIYWEIIRPAIVEEKEGKHIIIDKGFLNVNR